MQIEVLKKRIEEDVNPIKKKLANFLTETAKKGIDAMDLESPCVKALEGLDRDALLEENIQRISNEVSTLEAGKILKLAVKLKLSDAEDADRYKKEIKSVAFEVMERVENKYGGLSLPPECRDLLINL